MSERKANITRVELTKEQTEAIFEQDVFAASRALADYFPEDLSLMLAEDWKKQPKREIRGGTLYAVYFRWFTNTIIPFATRNEPITLSETELNVLRQILVFYSHRCSDGR